MHRLIEQFIILAGRLGHWGYLLVFIVIALECQALFGLFMPGESLVLVAGFLAGQRVFDLDILILTIAVAAVVGDSVGYEFGRRVGRGWLERHGRRLGIRREHFDRIDRFIGRHGGKSVFVSHFLHVFRALMPFVAGANRMPYGRFFVFNALGCTLWAVALTALGYFFGESWNAIAKWMGRAGALVGAVLLLGLVLGRLWTWLVQHEAEIRSRWTELLKRPKVADLLRRFSRQLEFLEGRLTPGGYLGLHLTIGATIVLLTGWWFGSIVEDLVTQDSMVTLDHVAAAWFNLHATATGTAIAKVITFAGSGVFITTASLGLALFCLWRKAWYRLVMLVLAVGGGSLLNLALKQVFHRSRPIIAHPLTEASGYSFPSGHTIGATLFYGLLAVFILQSVSEWRWRVLTLLLAGLIISMIGASRIYLAAHYLSDVLGAVAVGSMWLSVTITALEIDRRYRTKRRSCGVCLS